MMSITERNQRLYELRKRQAELHASLAWVEQEIWLVRDEYERAQRDTPLFEEMFGG